MVTTTFRNAKEEKIHNLLHDSFLGKYLDIETMTDVSFNGTHFKVQDNLKGKYTPDEQP